VNKVVYILARHVSSTQGATASTRLPSTTLNKSNYHMRLSFYESGCINCNRFGSWKVERSRPQVHVYFDRECASNFE